MAAPVRVLIADDVPQVRQSVKAMLALEQGLTVVGEAADGGHAVSLAQSLAPDVVVMDINMPGKDGITATEEIMATRPCGIVVISVQGEAEYLRRAMRAGACDYLTKPFTPEELIAAIRRAAAGAAERLSPGPAHGPVGGGQVITLFSTKGGVGRSVIAANLAVWLAQFGKQKVAAVDLDLEFGVLAGLTGARPAATWLDLTRVEGPLTPVHLERVMARPLRAPLGVLAAPPLPHQAAEVDGPGRPDPQRNYISEVLALLQGDHDFVVVDCATGFRDANLAALDAASQIWVVATPEVPALQNAAKGMDILVERLEYPRACVHLVLNRMHREAALSSSEVETGLGCPVAHGLPEDAGVSWAVSAGQPMVMKRSRSPFAQAIAAMGERLLTGTAPPAVPVRESKVGRLLPVLGGKRVLGLG